MVKPAPEIGVRPPQRGRDGMGDDSLRIEENA